ncbi:MAG: YbaB/EbfC family nucleoid-associated protein [Holosporales bacterium]|jgi:DNA-binding YbaB/EbfC family protein|nr:YbaB/EbfC family nucleoid-associated protein [Holosporales bacterium]
MNNMQQLLARAQKLQAKVAEVQKELENKDVSGAAGSGAVEVVMSMKGIVRSITISKDIINPDEKDLLEDLIVAALNDAKSKADKIYEEEMKAATGGLGLPGMM